MARAKKTTKKSTAPKTATKAAAAVSKIADAVTGKAESTETNVVLQYADKDLSYDELIQNAKNVYQYDMSGDPANIKKLDLFVKPDENKVYFVINDDVQGSYDL